MRNIDLVERYGKNVPRYTSYPTAPNFIPDIGKGLMTELHQSIAMDDRISLYLHIPYCDRLCWFCACHTKQTRHYAPVTQYVNTLIDEITLHRKQLIRAPKLAHIHLGGGSPSMMHSEDFERIAAALRQTFIIDDKTEISIEIDPNDMSQDMLLGLKMFNVTRASIGVQDFDPDVQNAINRPQTFKQTRDLVLALRDLGITSINIDALYGLPRQTLARLSTTIEKVISLNPDRVAMFGYAHVPWVKKHQQMIADSDLPGTRDRFIQSQKADDLLVNAGYQKIGIDHFAKPNDPLAKASKTGRLRRNFQGYTTDNCDVLLGIGASSISRSKQGYIQNIVPTGVYKDSVLNGEIPAAKGYRYTSQDQIRAYMIERLMCDFEISFKSMTDRFGSEAAPYIDIAKQIAALDQDQLSSADPDRFYINPERLPFTRTVASWFDGHLTKQQFKFSKAI